jgi:ribosomal protein S28E/S33
MVRVRIRLHAGIGYVTPDDVQVVGRTLLGAGQVLQVQVCAAHDGGPGGSPAGGHSRISSVERSAGSAFGNARVIARSVVGCVLGRRSHRRNASTAVSVPSR